MAAEELPCVLTVQLFAVIVPPPVTITPPELFDDVLIEASLIVIIPVPYAKTAFPYEASVVIVPPLTFKVAPLFTNIAALVP